MEAEFAALQAALLGIGDAIKPIMTVEDGSGRIRPRGSSFLLSIYDNRFHVTAAHVVEGPRPKIVGLSIEGGTLWPAEYSTLEPTTGCPTIDLAYATAKVAVNSTSGLQSAIPLDWCLPNEMPSPGQGLIAVGFPVSKSKVRQGVDRFKGTLTFVAGRVVEPAACRDLGVDGRVHVALSYDPESCEDYEGTSLRGPVPKGMSGGPLIHPKVGKRVDGTTEIQLQVVGVLAAFHPAPRNVMIATSITCFLDGIGDPRRNPPRLYRRCDA